MDYLLNIEHNDLVAILPSLLSNTDTQLECIEKVFQRILNFSIENEEKQTQTKQILQMIGGNTFPNILITQKLMELLLRCDFSLQILIIHLVVNIIGDSLKELKLVIETFSELKQDRKFYVPIIGTLSQLSLPKELQAVTFQLTVEALEFVDENDFPTIVRGLLNTLNKSNALEIMEIIRCQTVYYFSPQLTTLVFEVLGNTLQINSIAVNAFLSLLEKSPQTLSLFDSCVLLNLVGKNPSKSKPSSTLIRLCLSGKLNLELVIETFKQTHLFKSYSQDLFFICKFFLTEGNKHWFLLDWCYPLFEILFANYETCRNEIVSLLLSVCAVTSFNNEKERSVLVSPQILLAISKSQTRLLSLQVSFIEEVIQHSSTLHIEIYNYLCMALAQLCCYEENILNELFIFLQKNLFSTNWELQRTGIVCAIHILHTGIIPQRDIYELTNWILRLFNSCQIYIKLYIFDFFIYNFDKLPKDILFNFYENFLIPELKCPNLFINFPDLPGSIENSNQESITFVSNFYELLFKDYIDNESCIQIVSFVKSYSSKLNLIHPQYATILFTSYLTLRSILFPEYVLHKILIMPYFQISKTLSNSDEKIDIDSLWSAFYSYSISTKLLNYLEDFVPNYCVRNSNVRSRDFGEGFQQTIINRICCAIYFGNNFFAKMDLLKEFISSKSTNEDTIQLYFALFKIATNSSFNVTLKILLNSFHFLIFLQLQDSLELHRILYSEIEDIFLFHSNLEIGNISSSSLQSTISLNQEKIKSKLPKQLPIHLQPFVSVKTLSETRSSINLFSSIIESSLLSNMIQLITTNQKKLEETENIKEQRIIFQLLSYELKIITILLHFSKQTEGNLNRILNSIHFEENENFNQTQKREKFYQFFKRQLEISKDPFLSILIIDILICLTHGLKKSKEVSLLMYDQLKRKFHHEDPHLLLGKAPLSFGLREADIEKWNISSELFLKMLLTCFLRVMPNDKKAFHVSSILNAMQELQKERKSSHKKFLTLTLNTFSTFFEILIISLSSTLIKISFSLSMLNEVKEVEQILNQLCFMVYLANKECERNLESSILKTSLGTLITSMINLFPVIVKQLKLCIEIYNQTRNKAVLTSIKSGIKYAFNIGIILRQIGANIKNFYKKGKFQSPELKQLPKLTEHLSSYEDSIKPWISEFKVVVPLEQSILLEESLYNSSKKRKECSITEEDDLETSWGQNENFQFQTIETEEKDLDQEFDYFDFVFRKNILQSKNFVANYYNEGEDPFGSQSKLEEQTEEEEASNDTEDQQPLIINYKSLLRKESSNKMK